MDVDTKANMVQMSDNRSFDSNCQFRSQSRKMSIGVLVDSINLAEPKDIKETSVYVAEDGPYSKENWVKVGKQQAPVEQKHGAAAPDTLPWGSTTSFNRKMSSAAAVRDSEHTPSLLATGRSRPRSKLLETASATHSVNFFAGTTGLESDECIEKIVGAKIHSEEIGKVNADHVHNRVCSTEPEVVLEKEHAEDKTMNTETGGRETLRMKLWEVLGNVSSPSRHCSDFQPTKMHPDQMDGNQSHSDKKNPNSDTIESDSEMHTFRRSVTRSSIQNRASTKSRRSKSVAPKSTRLKKKCPEKRMLPQDDHSGRFSDNFNDCSLPFKRNKTGRLIPGGEIHQGRKHGNAEEGHQSQDKNRSVPAVGNPKVQKICNKNRSGKRISDVPVEPKKGIKKKSPAAPIDVMTEKLKNVEQPIDVTVTNLKNQQKDKCHSFSGNNRNSIHNPSTSLFKTKSSGCLPERNVTDIRNSGEEVFNRKGIRSFKSLMSSIPAEPNVQVVLSDRGCMLENSPLIKPGLIIEDGKNGVSKSSAEATDTESTENDSLMKGCMESKQVSPEIYVQEEFQPGSNKSVGHKKDVEVSGYSPMAEALEGYQSLGTQGTSKLQMNAKQNYEDGLARAVELFTVALARVQTKLKSFSNKRSSEILLAAADNILVLLQDAESHIKTDMGKLNNFTEQKRKRLETRFEDQQDQLLGICNKFKEEIGQHLRDYGGMIEDLEEHEIEFKKYVDRQRAAHRKSLSQVEQEIKIQLDDAECRILDVQELARERMVHLKLVVAEFNAAASERRTQAHDHTALLTAYQHRRSPEPEYAPTRRRSQLGPHTHEQKQLSVALWLPPSTIAQTLPVTKNSQVGKLLHERLSPLSTLAAAIYP
ncbi:Unknown protein [Striga hermonthica]|uniref:Meiosis-specific protein ASY3-like coiled-coil domain-containing protein n=1 Tax=Striga hermonthica TaxID=68872 RepID=A0A9N7N804_STRHE|nr:Unknown protein [Striga hermonthica]